MSQILTEILNNGSLTSKSNNFIKKKSERRTISTKRAISQKNQNDYVPKKQKRKKGPVVFDEKTPKKIPLSKIGLLSRSIGESPSEIEEYTSKILQQPKNVPSYNSIGGSSEKELPCLNGGLSPVTIEDTSVYLEGITSAGLCILDINSASSLTKNFSSGTEENSTSNLSSVNHPAAVMSLETQSSSNSVENVSTAVDEKTPTEQSCSHNADCSVESLSYEAPNVYNDKNGVDERSDSEDNDRCFEIKIDKSMFGLRNNGPLESYVGEEGTETVKHEWMDSHKNYPKRKPKSRFEGKLHYEVKSKYQFQYNQMCLEAVRGDNFGSREIKWRAPGFPKKKFTEKDRALYGDNESWPVQGIYPVMDYGLTKEQQDVMRYVVYEGWTSETGENRKVSELKETARGFLKEFEFREAIVKSISECYSLSKKATQKWSFRGAVDMWRQPDSVFWCYEDFSYHVNILHKEERLGPIYFVLTNMVSRETLKKLFPAFSYTTKMVLDDDIIPCLEKLSLLRAVDQSTKERIMQKKRAIPSKVVKIDENSDDSEFKKKPLNVEYNLACPSDLCLCVLRKTEIYGVYVKRLAYNGKGLLMLNNYRMKQGRIVLECSDTCGCDDSCPTRQCQKGQQIPLVVCYEGDKGFGVRAGGDIEKGEFIIEYLGVLTDAKKATRKDQNYLMDLVPFILVERQNGKGKSTKETVSLTIDATDTGNISRYFNHSCDPNAIIVEVHSRRREDDLLVPTAAYYAYREIRKGEEITVSYWNQQRLKETALNPNDRVECNCNTKKCRGFIPKC